MLRLVSQPHQITPVLVFGSVEVSLTREQALEILTHAVHADPPTRTLRAPLPALVSRVLDGGVRRRRARVPAAQGLVVTSKSTSAKAAKHPATAKAAAQRKKGLCSKCGSKPLDGKKVCRKHYALIVHAQRAATAKRKRLASQ